MKSNLSSSSDMKTQGGPAYWRSLDELAEKPEFRQWVEREFPEGATEWTDPVSRRHFVKIMSASFLLAGLGLTSGCRRPVERIVPFSRLPEGYIHGVAEYYATAMAGRRSAIPLVVRSHDGRPIKIEGNAMYPGSNGATDRWAQASILNLYDPDRASRSRERGDTRTPEAAAEFLSRLGRTSAENQGQGLAFLMESGSSPSRVRLQQVLSQKMPQAKWFIHDGVDLEADVRATAEVFGKPVHPHYLFDKADVVLSLDCDFIGSEENTLENIRRFTSRRRVQSPNDTPVRLYQVEGLMTVTGFAADHRLRLAPSQIPALAASIAAQIQGLSIPGLQAPALPSAIDPKWVAECARDLANRRGKSLVIAGHRQPPAVHALAHALNATLGNIGQTVVYHEIPSSRGAGLVELAKALNEGRVETLVILGGNPVYTAPADLNWAVTQRKAKTIVRLGYYEDETFEVCDWHLPAAHYLECWGDVRLPDGTVAPVQPLIAPLFNGWTELEILARIAGEPKPSPHEIARATFNALAGDNASDELWKKYLHDGFLADSAVEPAAVQANVEAVGKVLADLARPAPSKDRLEVIFHRDYSVDDGRYNNNGWLQEMPDPVTKLVWDNAVLLSRKTARALNVANSDVVEISVEGRTIRGPVWVQPGQADYTVGLALGYGRTRTGRVGAKTGFNAYPLRVSGAQHAMTGAAIKATGQRYSLSCPQSHWSMEGRPIIREANLEQYRKDPHFARKMGADHSPVVTSLYPNPLEAAKAKAFHQWGMSIDLNLCIGCSACVIACQSENNVPIVGKDQVAKGREMHWLRVDRYYAGRPKAAEGSEQSRTNFLQTYNNEPQQQFEEWIDNPQAVTQPMLCQHCEAAPCENVCPVNATSHDHEGLNVMTYNRCVGTRYCSNNCPYKVRRFNFFDYNKRPIDKLYLGPLAKRPEDEWDLIKMIKNPDVTVRMRGVMEKCTFCLQRIESAKITQKVKAGASGDVVVPDGMFTTACAQACPAGAIVFGNISDPGSQVSKLKQLDRDYSVLEILHTRPRTTYLARLRNPNQAMPDYYEVPQTYQEFESTLGHAGEGAHPVGGHIDHGHNGHAAPSGPEKKGAH